MRKRVFIPLFILFVFFPIIIYLLSYTRFFNDEVRNILVTVVDDGTNAKLRLGEIQGSIFGSFTIDGAALLYHDEPIALVDTIRISHLPLSLIMKTVQATHVELIHPRFYLIRSKDGSFNVDHIGKPGGKPGGAFDWTLFARSLKIVRGEFCLYDSTVVRTAGEAAGDGVHRFDASDFKVKDLNLSASADLSGQSLSAKIRSMSMVVDPPGLRVDSLNFNFFTTPGGTEVTGLHLVSGRTRVHVDVTLEGQDILDSLSGNTIRKKYFTASVNAVDADVRKVDGFVKIPVRLKSDFDLSLFASGSLDSLDVKQCILRTDSSIVPVFASFRHLVDSTMSLNVSTENASVDMAELSSVLKDIGFPDVRRLHRMKVTADVRGRPSNLMVRARLANRSTSVSAHAALNPGSYDGSLAFRGLNLGDVLGNTGLKTGFNGAASFSVAMNGKSIPEGNVSVTIDSSTFDHTSVRHVQLRVLSTGDSLGAEFNILTSKGNVGGLASLNVRSESYSGDVKFSELDLAPFVHLPTLHGDMTGRLAVNGRGFDIDSLRTQVTLLTERAKLGNFPIGNSAFTVLLNTERAQKELQIHSPYLDAGVYGKFIPRELPGQLSGLFTSLSNSFSSKFVGGVDTSRFVYAGAPVLDADVDVDIKDARFLGQLIGSGNLTGEGSTHFHLAANRDTLAMSGFVSADTMDYSGDSLHIRGGSVNLGFDYSSDPHLPVWDSGNWSTHADVGSFWIGNTKLAAKNLSVKYVHGDSVTLPQLQLHVRGQVDTLVDFRINASGSMTGNKFNFIADTLDGNVRGIPLISDSPVSFDYSRETFSISPATFKVGLGGENADSVSKVTASGSYSLLTGADLHFLFANFGLSSLQRIVRLDTNALKLDGRVYGRADLRSLNKSMLLSLDFRGNNIYYNGSIARLVHGEVALDGPLMKIDADLSKSNDSTSYALRLKGTVPLAAESPSQMRVDLAADSLNVSFLTPLLAGVEDFGGTLSGNMVVSGKYSSPEMKGKLVLDGGRIRLAANEVNYLYNGTIIGDGNKIKLEPFVVRDVPGQAGGSAITARGSITIGKNTIQKFNLIFDGDILALNSSARKTLRGIYGSAVVGAGKEGLRLEGSLQRPMLLGTLNIQSADLTLLPIQAKENLTTQEIVYRFPPLHPAGTPAKDTVEAPPTQSPKQSGSFIDSLRYDVRVETKDNVSLRMIFDPTTNEELYAVLGGRLHLSNLSGTNELTGNVNVQNNSYYNFYGRRFAATGKLSFTGDPLNPIMDITAQYQGEMTTDSASTSGGTSTPKTQNVVVQLGISGTFNHPNAPQISMTVDGMPYQGDVQTNAMWFILTNQFDSQLTSRERTSVASDLLGQAGQGIFTSVLSGALTNVFSREFSFVRSAQLRYSSFGTSSFSLTNPDLAITTQFGKATIRIGGQVFSSISNTDVSVDYPLTELLSNMLYLQLSHKISVSDRTNQRLEVYALRLLWQLSF